MIHSYKELPIGKYMIINGICKEEAYDDITKQVKIISILADMSEDEVLHLPLPDYKTMAAATRFLEDVDHDRHKAARRYILGDWVLLPTMDYRKMETAQFVDFQTFAPIVDTHLPELLSCLLVPEGHRYNEGYDITEVQRAIREELSVTDALSLSAFFLTRFKALLTHSLDYSLKMSKGLPKEERIKVEGKIHNLQRMLL